MFCLISGYQFHEPIWLSTRILEILILATGMASELSDAIRSLCLRTPSWHRPFPWLWDNPLSTISILACSLWQVLSGKHQSTKKEKENNLWLTKDTMAVVNLLLLSFKMNDLMRVHYKNNAFNQEIWFCGMQHKIVISKRF